MAKKRRFKRGDVVRVIASPPPDWGVGPSWSQWMSGHCGRVYVIDRQSQDDRDWFHLRGCDESFQWHWTTAWLLPATKCQLVLDRIYHS